MQNQPPSVFINPVTNKLAFNTQILTDGFIRQNPSSSLSIAQPRVHHRQIIRKLAATFKPTTELTRFTLDRDWARSRNSKCDLESLVLEKARVDADAVDTFGFSFVHILIRFKVGFTLLHFFDMIMLKVFSCIIVLIWLRAAYCFDFGLNMSLDFVVLLFWFWTEYELRFYSFADNCSDVGLNMGYILQY